MENVTEELVRQNGNQAAAVMADYAGQGGGGGGSNLEIITPKIVKVEDGTPEEEILGAGMYAVLQEMPEAGKAYNLPFSDKGMMIPIFIVSIDTEENIGSCLFMSFTGSSNYSTRISFVSGDYDRSPTLTLVHIPEELQLSLGGTIVASINQSLG